MSPYRYKLTSKGMVKRLVRSKLKTAPGGGRVARMGTITPQQFVRGNTSLGSFMEDEKSYYMNFPSSSSPGTVYQTRIWTRNDPKGRFHVGDVSCNCKGYIFNHHCHHQTDAAVEWQKNPNVPHIALNLDY